MAAVRTGIDISPTTITAAQVRVTDSRWVVLAHASMNRRSSGPVLDREDAIALESLLFRRGFASAPCVISAPENAIRSTTLELPPIKSGAPIDQLARAEFARRHKLDAHGFELSYWALPASGQSLHVMAVGCETGPTDEAIVALESAGLLVAGVDDSTRALGRVLASVPTLATVRVGARLDAWGASIVVLHHGTVLYMRSPNGLVLGRDAIEHAEAAQRLAGEIDACVAFARHRSRSHAPASVSVLGQAAQNDVLMDMLGQRFGDALAQPVAPDGSPLDPALAVAVGLTLLEDLA